MKWIVLLFSCLLSGNSGTQTEGNDYLDLRSENDCIRRILTKDTSLGSKRNNDCVDVSLSTTIERYVSALSGLDYSDCPAAFKTAFKKHIDAWSEMKQVTDKFPAIREEMHVLFDKIELTQDSTLFKKLLDKVWLTWEVVEKESGVFD